MTTDPSGMGEPSSVLSTGGLRLNLGCGYRKMEGFLNVDSVGDPDFLLDLETLPWPWASDSVTEVFMSHVMEHLGATSHLFLGIIQELYRVCASGAMVWIIVPHPRHDAFISDPTHIRPITVHTLELFDARRNRQWIRDGAPNSKFALSHHVDFQIVSIQQVLSSEWQAKWDSGKLSEEELQHAMTHLNNVIVQSVFRWKVIKPQRL